MKYRYKCLALNENFAWGKYASIPFTDSFIGNMMHFLMEVSSYLKSEKGKSNIKSMKKDKKFSEKR